MNSYNDEYFVEQILQRLHNLEIKVQELAIELDIKIENVNTEVIDQAEQLDSFWTRLVEHIVSSDPTNSEN